MRCVYCKKQGASIEFNPSRWLCSPCGYNQFEKKPHSLVACSPECVKEFNKRIYAFWATIDRNASDSECFVHESWDGKMRVGYCSKTGKRVRVEPMMHGDNSGQPKSCYDHFVLHNRYGKFLSEESV